jgi:hypothetical protein
VAAGIVGEVGDVFEEAGRAALEDLVRFVAAADLDFVRLLEIPAHAAFRAVDAEAEAAFPTGGDLRDAGVGVHAVGEAVFGLAELEQHAAEVLGIDLVVDHLFRIDLREGLHFAFGALAGLVEGLDVRKDASALAPSTKLTASIQCVPMSPTARSLPPSLARMRQL